MLVDEGRIRIKPNKTYYRSIKEKSGALEIYSSGTPFVPFDDWAKNHYAVLIKDFEIEEPPTVTEETITLYEFNYFSSPENQMAYGWTEDVLVSSPTGRTGTLVIKGDVS